jgi:hypothetical protein
MPQPKGTVLRKLGHAVTMLDALALPPCRRS